MEEREEKLRRVTLKQRFSAKRLALMAVFTVLSYAVSRLEFPLFAAFPVLQLDFGNIFILLIAFLLGPVEGVIVCVLKESLRMIGGTVVGEIANMLMTSAYILLPSVIYQFKKGLKWVLPSLGVACLIGAGVALLVNYFITFPLFEGLYGSIFGLTAKEAFAQFWGLVLAFNLIKTVSVSVLTALLYKRLSNFLKKWKI